VASTLEGAYRGYLDAGEAMLEVQTTSAPTGYAMFVA
jgi:hypothetical protein